MFAVWKSGGGCSDIGSNAEDDGPVAIGLMPILELVVVDAMVEGSRLSKTSSSSFVCDLVSSASVSVFSSFDNFIVSFFAPSDGK